MLGLESEEASVNTERQNAEWGEIKFNLDDWKSELPREIMEGKCATSTTWTLHRVTSQPSLAHSFPVLSSLAECCLSIPVSNAWPERGASALKRVKARLRDRLKNDLLRQALHVSINGSPIESDEFVLQLFVQL